MLRTNLSTRPFYNDRLVRLGITIGAALAAVLTAYNVAQVVGLTSRSGELSRVTETAEARAAELRSQAATMRRTLDQGEVSLVQAAAREANVLIERRAFSWTELFNRFEDTLPADVRIAAVQPQVDERGQMLLAITVISRRVEDLDQFIDELEKTQAFRDVLSRQEMTEDDGNLRSVLQGYYGPPPPVAPSPAAGATVPGSNATPVTPANTTPPAPGGRP